MMLTNHVFPAFESEHGFLRARVIYASLMYTFLLKNIDLSLLYKSFFFSVKIVFYKGFKLLGFSKKVFWYFCVGKFMSILKMIFVLLVTYFIQ